MRLDHGCAVKTWATAPPLKTVVPTGSMVSGAAKGTAVSCSARRHRDLARDWPPDLTAHEPMPLTPLERVVTVGTMRGLGRAARGRDGAIENIFHDHVNLAAY